MGGYPEFGHIGFKILCACWGIASVNYMRESIECKIQKLRILKDIQRLNEESLRSANEYQRSAVPQHTRLS
jgi:hypothetical protein